MPVDREGSLRCLQMVADYLRAEAKNEPFVPSTQLPVENQDLFGSVLHLAKSYVRARRDSTVGDRLCQQLQILKVPEPCIQQAIVILESLKQELQNASSIRCLPIVQALRWRVDITISSSVLSRVLEPTIIMELELDSKEKIMIQVSVAKFHKLRYSTAHILTKIEALENAVASVPV